MKHLLGYLVANKNTEHVLEGRDMSAKIFETDKNTHYVGTKVTGSTLDWTSTPIGYESVCTSLEKGAAFSFESAETHQRFIRRLRNDPGRKSRVSASQDKDFIQWVAPVKTEKPAPSVLSVEPPPLLGNAPPAPEVPPAPWENKGNIVFNPAVLLKS